MFAKKIIIFGKSFKGVRSYTGEYAKEIHDLEDKVREENLDISLEDAIAIFDDSESDVEIRSTSNSFTISRGMAYERTETAASVQPIKRFSSCQAEALGKSPIIINPNEHIVS
jgi:hypothetical protein